jgi:hypothetical protein
VWRNAQQRRSLVARCAQPRHIGVLQVTNATVNYLEAFGGSRAAEIRALDQRRAQPSQGGVTCRGCTERTCADDQDVVLSI